MHLAYLDVHLQPSDSEFCGEDAGKFFFLMTIP